MAKVNLIQSWLIGVPTGDNTGWWLTYPSEKYELGSWDMLG
jgi:hypothetical protein